MTGKETGQKGTKQSRKEQIAMEKQMQMLGFDNKEHFAKLEAQKRKDNGMQDQMI